MGCWGDGVCVHVTERRGGVLLLEGVEAKGLGLGECECEMAPGRKRGFDPWDQPHWPCARCRGAMAVASGRGPNIQLP